MNSFPYKHLIWACVVVVGLLLFRQAWMHLIVQTQEITLFDKVKIKVKKSDSEALALAKITYEGEVKGLTSEIDLQQSKIQSLTEQTTELLAAIQNCTGATPATDLVRKSLDDLKKVNIEVLKRSNVLTKTKVFKQNLDPGK